MQRFQEDLKYVIEGRIGGKPEFWEQKEDFRVTVKHS